MSVYLKKSDLFAGVRLPWFPEAAPWQISFLWPMKLRNKTGKAKNQEFYSCSST
jgi:hypothetical protein